MNKLSKSFYVKVAQLEDATNFFKDCLEMEVEENLLIDSEQCVLVKANADTQIFLSRKNIENQTAPITLATNDCLENYCRLKVKGIVFKNPPAYSSDGLSAIFSDPFGNDYRLLEQRTYSEF